MASNSNDRPTYDPIVFSRKRTYNSPTTGSSLSSVIHQADKDGNQLGGQKKMAIMNKDQGVENRKGLSKLFADLCTCLGMSEAQQQMQQLPSPAPTATAAPPSPTRSAPKRLGYLGPLHPNDQGKKCLVLDLDETLVHSSFKPTKNPDYIIPVEIDGNVHNVYVSRRPGAVEFLRDMAQFYEIVVFTASLSKYADPLLDQLDVHNTIRYRLFREHCVRHEGNYVKDLSVLDRDLSQTIIIDNSPLSYIFHPQNAIGCSSYIDDPKDRELDSISRFLVDIADEKDIRMHCFRWTPQYIG